MNTTTTRYQLLSLAVLFLLVASLLTACGGGSATGTTSTATPVARPTNTPIPPTPTPEPEPTVAEMSQFESLLRNIERLAPVHIVSTLSAQEGSNTPQVTRFESDVDSAGSHHMKLFDGDVVSMEIYVVDKQMYMGSAGQFMALGGQDTDPWAIVATYGGAFLWIFDTAENARFLGREQVNGFDTNKYAFELDTATLGLLGFMAQQGNTMEYEGFVWVEMNAAAAVKSQVSIRVKSATGAIVSETIASFDAEETNIPLIEKPVNVTGP